MMNFNTSELPKQFGPYLLKQKIARGGMAELFLAEVKGPGGFIKPLVIKTIHPAFSGDDRFLAMFTEEAKILSGLTHGNIVPIFDFGEYSGLWYLAMEFIDGVDVATLTDICRISGISLPLDISLFIGAGTAAALSCVHHTTDAGGTPIGLVHRDVSPHNILVSRTGEVKLCDFGLAIQTVSDDIAQDEIKGKLKYLSPEQARGIAVDNRSDLFSLGVVLYELIAGHHPVTVGTDVTILQTLTGGKGFPPIREIAPWVAPKIAELVDRAVAFTPEARFQKAEEMRANLTKILHQRYPDFTPQNLAELVVNVQSASESLTSDDEDSIIRARLATFASESRQIGRPPTRKRWRRAILAVGVLLGAALLVGLLMKGRSPDSRDGAGGNLAETGSSDDPLTAPPDVAPPKAPPDPPATRDTDSIADADAGADTGDAPNRAQASPKPAKGSNGRAKPKEIGTVDINASPWADVSIDGVEYTTTPIIGLKLTAGKHEVTLVNPELKITKTRTFVVKPDETVRVLVEME